MTLLYTITFLMEEKVRALFVNTMLLLFAGRKENRKTSDGVLLQNTFTSLFGLCASLALW
jgi:hypothetical protein